MPLNGGLLVGSDPSQCTQQRCHHQKQGRWQTAPQECFTSSSSFHQVRSAGSGTESQLRVSWDGVLNAEQAGRWWIVGSAWSGAPMIDSSQQKAPQKPLAGTVGDACSPLPVGLSVALPRAAIVLSAGCYEVG